MKLPALVTFQVPYFLYPTQHADPHDHRRTDIGAPYLMLSITKTIDKSLYQLVDVNGNERWLHYFGGEAEYRVEQPATPLLDVL
jgi:hypothetical protein